MSIKAQKKKDEALNTQLSLDRTILVTKGFIIWQRELAGPTREIRSR